MTYFQILRLYFKTVNDRQFICLFGIRMDHGKLVGLLMAAYKLFGPSRVMTNNP